jgi:hypothetical protein
LGEEPISSRISTDNRIKVNEFTYLGYTLSHQGEGDIFNETAKYTKTVGVINNVLKPPPVQ